MPYRPNPFLERKHKPRPPPPPAPPSLFQRTRDWTALVVSLTSLLTATIALKGTLTGPRPFLAQLAGDGITILRSDQFTQGTPARPGIMIRNEFGARADFPLLIVQATLANRAAAPNGVGVRAIEGELTISQAGRTLFRSVYDWYRLTTSSLTRDGEDEPDRIAIESAIQTAPFDLAGGSTWSREVLLIPRRTWDAASWAKLAAGVEGDCYGRCQGEFALRVRLDDGATLTESCNFTIDEHVRAHLGGTGRRYVTSPQCSMSGQR